MSRYAKYTDEFKEKARTMLILTGNLSQVATELGIAKSTLGTWKKEWEENMDKEEIEKIRTKRRLEIVDETWNVVQLGLKITKEGMGNLDTSEMSASDINSIANATSKVHQMHQLASGEATENVNVSGKVDFSEIEE